tara:strand:+ start:871 stop:1812 length:942 start_codon:yes stop_codon:yes gene_type:complete
LVYILKNLVKKLLMNSPIVIFSYNRPKHINKLLNTIIKNEINKNNKIYLFCDGPKNTIDKKKIDIIKKIIEKKKIIFHYKIFRKKNLGLSKNIIDGVSYVLKKHSKCIVLEDDLVINKNCLKFMNLMLIKLKDNKDFGSVSAHSYIDEYKTSKEFDFYITKRHCSWCWGTWSRVWNKIEWNKIDYTKHFSNDNETKNFSLGGKDLNLLLWGNYKKIINSWAIRFNYFCSKKKLNSFQPRFSMIRNDGRDFTGTHEKFSFSKNKRYDFSPKISSTKNIFFRTLRSAQIDSYIKNKHRRSFKLLIRFFLENKRIL